MLSSVSCAWNPEACTPVLRQRQTNLRKEALLSVNLHLENEKSEVCVKFGTSKHLAFEGQESGTVSDHFYRNDVMSVDGVITK